MGEALGEMGGAGEGMMRHIEAGGGRARHMRHIEVRQHVAA